MIITYLIITTLIFSFFGGVWNRETIFDVVVKTTFLSMSAWGMMFIILYFGNVLKITINN